MRQWNLDIMLYDAGALGLTNALIDGGKLTWLPDDQALDCATWYLAIEAYDLGHEINPDALRQFLLHAQRAGKLNGEFMMDSFTRALLATVPQNPPVSPMIVSVQVVGNSVTVTSNLGLFCDRYELWAKLDGQASWAKVTDGMIGEGEVTYSLSSVPIGSHEARTQTRYGFFAGFPGMPEAVVVV